MKKILMIHGFGGSKDSETGKLVKQYIEKNYIDYEVILESFDLLDIKGTKNKIKKIMRNKDFSMIISHSLGAFYCLNYSDSVAKIIINPCMKPSIELPKILKNATKEELESFKKYFNLDMSLLTKNFIAIEDQTYKEIKDDCERQYTTYGIFGKNDELFSYKDFYIEVCKAKENMITEVNSGHKLYKKDLEESIKNSLSYFAKLC